MYFDSFRAAPLAPRCHSGSRRQNGSRPAHQTIRSPPRLPDSAGGVFLRREPITAGLPLYSGDLRCTADSSSRPVAASQGRRCSRPARPPRPARRSTTAPACRRPGRRSRPSFPATRSRRSTSSPRRPSSPSTSAGGCWWTTSSSGRRHSGAPFTGRRSTPATHSSRRAGRL